MAPVPCLTKGIARISPTKYRSTLWRLDLLPFVALHAAFFALSQAARVKATLYEFSTPLLVGASVVLHVLAFLFEVWSVRWFNAVRCFPAPLELADAVLVEPEAHAGQPAMVPLKRVKAKHAIDAAAAAGGDGAKVGLAGASGQQSQLSEVAASWLRLSTLQFVYNSCTYQLVTSPRSPGGVAFDRLDCPDAAPVHVYTAWHGWKDADSIEAAGAKWGANSIHMPSPTFSELMMEHALAPFFVFQIGCVALWALDDYWYYSLFTLAMLVGLEAVLVAARMKQNSQLRGMRPPPLPLYVYRAGRWAVVTSDKLVPGDIVSVSQSIPGSGSATQPPPPVRRPGFPNHPSQQSQVSPPAAAQQQVVCPADLLLLRGSAVLNEAMLTGESAPQMKDAITCDETTAPSNDNSGGASALLPPGHSGAKLNAFLPEGSRSHSRHIVFGGTIVIQSSPASANEEDGDNDVAASAAAGGGGSGNNSTGGGSSQLAHVPHPPDGGATAIVLRTGAYTSQGELMRTIQGSTSKVSAGNREAFIFICGLLCFALYSSHYVLTHAWNDPARNRWKLILHCIMIITSVVPPELPVELALAVNSSIATLARRGIFCTEPWRITLAGKVDVAAFDKTGTLTSDEFTVNGVVLLPDPASGGADRSRLVPAPAVPLATLHVLAGCHSLMSIAAPPPPPPPPPPRQPLSAAAAYQQAATPSASAAAAQPKAPGRQLIGDPLEKSTLTSLGWTVTSDGTARPRMPGAGDDEPSSSATPGSGAKALKDDASGAATSHPHAGHAVKVVKRWPFSAEVKRMSCAVSVTLPPSSSNKTASSSPASSSALDSIARSAPSSSLRIVAKGAPEVMAPLLTSVPADYDVTYRALTLTGARVLALAYRVLPPSVTSAEVRSWPRSKAEKDLVFAGFLALSSPLKTDSVRTVTELAESGHRVMMITGDAPFTAVAVAQQCGIIGKAASAAAAIGSGEKAFRPRSKFDARSTPAASSSNNNSDARASSGNEVWILEQAGGSAVEASASTASTAGSKAASTSGSGSKGDFGLCWSIVTLPPRPADSSSTAAVAAAVAALPRGKAGTASCDAAAADVPAADPVQVRHIPFSGEALLASSTAGKGSSATSSVASSAPPVGAAICVTGAALRALTTAHLKAKAQAAHCGQQASADVSSGGSSSGNGWPLHLASPLIYSLCLSAAVFARVSPDQKEAVIVTLNAGGQLDSDEDDGGANGSSSSSAGGAKQTGGKAKAAAAAAGDAGTGTRHTTLMCGDGTNDVGALKQASVGVSIISNPELEKQYDVLRMKQATAAKERREKMLKAQTDNLLKLAGGNRDHWAARTAAKMEADARARDEVVDEGEEEELTSLLKAERASATLTATPAEGEEAGGLEAMLMRSLAPPTGTGSGDASGAAPTDPAAIRRAELNKKLAEKLKELQNDGAGGGMETGGPVMVALGDASIASPFTSKLPSPGAVTEILRQGRCTLVTTHQMYKILAVNSLILSYQLSVLYLHGVKGGDYQATIGGMSIAAFFFFISWAKPLKRLAPVRPYTTVFNPPLLLAVTGQFLVHLFVLATAVSLCRPFAAVDSALTSAANTIADPESTLSTEEANAAIRALMEGRNWTLPAERLVHNGTDEDGNSNSSSTSFLSSEEALSPSSLGSSDGDAAASVTADDVAPLVAGLKPLSFDEPAVEEAVAEVSVGASGSFDQDDEFGASTVISADKPAAAAPTPRLPVAAAAGARKAAADIDPALDLKAALKAKAAAKASASGTAEGGAGDKSGKPKYLEDAKFAPNIINTVVFLVSVTSQAATFVVNYTGRPFMQPLSENKGLLNLAALTFGVALLAASGLSSDLLSMLQLVELPTASLKASVAGLIVLDAVCCIGWEALLRKVFGVGIPVRA